MEIKDLVKSYPIDRETLEILALEEVCACLYYDLADSMDATGDQELIDIITHNYDCDMCGQTAHRRGGSNA